MIYTITLSPAIDYFLTTDSLISKDTINRASATSFRVGGKGLNVSTTLNTLGIKSTAITLLGGFSGDYIEATMSSLENCTVEAIQVDEITRINVKLDDGDNKYSINAPGPIATDLVKDQLLSKLTALQPNDFVMLCGSRVPGIDDKWLHDFSQLINSKQAHLVLDMEQIDLELLSSMKPFLIKPNLHELKILMGKPLDEEVDIHGSIKELLKVGVKNVLLSLGEDGALLIDEHTQYKVSQKIMHQVNDVGMGDAMLGTFIGMLSKSSDRVEALRYAAAAGSATASTKERIGIDHIQRELMNIDIQ